MPQPGTATSSTAPPGIKWDRDGRNIQVTAPDQGATLLKMLQTRAASDISSQQHNVGPTEDARQQHQASLVQHSAQLNGQLQFQSTPKASNITSVSELEAMLLRTSPAAVGTYSQTQQLPDSSVPATSSSPWASAELPCLPSNPWGLAVPTTPPPMERSESMSVSQQHDGAPGAAGFNASAGAGLTLGGVETLPGLMGHGGDSQQQSNGALSPAAAAAAAAQPAASSGMSHALHDAPLGILPMHLLPILLDGNVAGFIPAHFQPSQHRHLGNPHVYDPLQPNSLPPPLAYDPQRHNHIISHPPPYDPVIAYQAQMLVAQMQAASLNARPPPPPPPPPLQQHLQQQQQRRGSADDHRHVTMPGGGPPPPPLHPTSSAPAAIPAHHTPAPPQSLSSSSSAALAMQHSMNSQRSPAQHILGLYGQHPGLQHAASGGVASPQLGSPAGSWAPHGMSMMHGGDANLQPPPPPRGSWDGYLGGGLAMSPQQLRFDSAAGGSRLSADLTARPSSRFGSSGGDSRSSTEGGPRPPPPPPPPLAPSVLGFRLPAQQQHQQHPHYQGGPPPPHGGSRRGSLDVPDLRPGWRCRADMQALDKQLQALAEELRPSPEERLRHQGAFDRVRLLLLAEWPASRVHLFGSTANGLCIASSNDIDVCLELPDVVERAPKEAAIAKMTRLFEAAGMQSIQPLPHARVPVCKYNDPSTNIHVDVTINNMLALVNTKMLRDYCELDARVRPLTYVIKHWAKQRNVNDSYRGTLSSYAYVLQCLALLQQRSPPILPALQATGRNTFVQQVAGYDCSYCDDLDSLRGCGAANKETLAELVVAYFDYWGCRHDYNHGVVSIRKGGVITKEEKDWTCRIGSERHLLCIEDPFQTDHDLGRTVDHNTCQTLRREYERASWVMHNEADPLKELLKRRQR